MAVDHEKVMGLVERELEKDPKISSQALYDKAQKIEPEVSKLSLRQFHAKYPLQVKRRKASKPAKKGARARKTRASKKTAATRKPAARAAESAPSHDAVRKVLLRFAKDVAAAEGKTETIDLVANVDRYVTQIVKASRG